MRAELLVGTMMVASLAGCVSHTWAPGPGVHATFAEQTAQCRILARHGGSGFYASGSASYVAGVAIGNAIGNAIQANADFNDCMAANGWEVADQAPAATQIEAPMTPTAPSPAPIESANSGPRVTPIMTTPTPAPLTPCGEDRPCITQSATVGG